MQSEPLTQPIITQDGEMLRECIRFPDGPERLLFSVYSLLKSTTSWHVNTHTHIPNNLLCMLPELERNSEQRNADLNGKPKHAMREHSAEAWMLSHPAFGWRFCLSTYLVLVSRFGKTNSFQAWSCRMHNWQWEILFYNCFFFFNMFLLCPCSLCALTFLRDTWSSELSVKASPGYTATALSGWM